MLIKILPNILLDFRLSICIFVPLTQIAQSLTRLLNDERYGLTQLNTSQELRHFVEQNKEQIDCLIILNDPNCLPVVNEFYEQGILLPVIIIEPDGISPELRSIEQQTERQSNIDTLNESPTHLYHSGEVRLSLQQLGKITTIIDRAITRFLHLGPSCPLSERPTNQTPPQQVEDKQNFFLLLQQRRLAEKLKERLGYLGVYYNRNSQYFYRHLPQAERTELREQLSEEYREIILHYFADETEVNQEIDQFVNRAFFSDISVSQILEIHMQLMDEFSQQLKLEGRNEEILLDYRLALIDIIAHLCEMYRRSIPRENLPFDILFPID